MFKVTQLHMYELYMTFFRKYIYATEFPVTRFCFFFGPDTAKQELVMQVCINYGRGGRGRNFLTLYD